MFRKYFVYTIFFSLILTFDTQSSSFNLENETPQLQPINISRIYDFDLHYQVFDPIIEQVRASIFTINLGAQIAENFITNMHSIVFMGSIQCCKINLESITISFELPNNQALKNMLIDTPQAFNSANFLQRIHKNNRDYFMTELYLATIKRDKIYYLKSKPINEGSYTLIKDLDNEIEQHFNKACRAKNVNPIFNKHLLNGEASLSPNEMNKVIVYTHPSK